jgi:multiple sugar transport system substrate-binding protein/putative aldouronate transport system substrate-binding protein
MKKKAISVLLASAMVVSLAACGSTSGDSSSTSSDSTSTSSDSASTDSASADATEAYELTEINVVVNGTLTATEDNGQAEFVEQWEAAVSEKLGHDIKLNITQYDHSGYSDAVGRFFQTL